MDARTTQTLLDINDQFYQTFAAAFAATRRRIQPGIHRVLASIPPDGRWVDLGCGSGALSAEWARQQRRGLYLGLDFSEELLAEARQTAAETSHPGLEIRFGCANLGLPDWSAGLEEGSFDGALAFASLHHLPGYDLRLNILRQVRRLLKPGGIFYHSEWQFQHSPKLLARRQPWRAAGLDEAMLEPGDTLLDWRYALPGQPETTGLRYVHLFSLEELQELAAAAGFKIIETFESDGEGGRLAVYQQWTTL